MKTIRTFVNAAEAGFAGSLLESAGIRTLLKGEQSFMMTPGLATGGIQLQVEDEDVDRAVRLLDKGFDAVTEESRSDTEAETETPAAMEHAPVPRKAGRRRGHLGLMVVGAMALGLMAYGVHQWDLYHPPQPRDADFDHDGRPDHFYVYRDDGTLLRILVDHNGDGAVDEWITYDREGNAEHTERDTNFDARPDVWSFYENGEIQSRQRDTDFDGVPDWFGTYEHGLIVREDCRPGDSTVVVRRHIFVNAVLREEQVDEDRDGKFDYRILYDAFGTPSDRMPIEAAK